MRWLLVLVIACGGAPPHRAAPAAVPADELALYRAKTIDALDAFLVKYPDSKYRNDALLQLADLQFDAGQIGTALGLYQMAQFPEDDDRGWYARYRIAWCQLNLGDRTAAIAEMTAVAHAELTGTKPRAQLVETANKDLISWQETASDPTYVRADQLYAQHLFCEAAPLYAEVARGTTSDRVEAAYAHVLSTISCLHLDDAKADGSPPWQQVLAATDLYMATAKVPMPSVRFKRGQILYASSRFTEAATEFRAIVTGTPADETAPYAAALLLDSDQQAHGDVKADMPAACAIKTDLLADVCQPAAPTTSSRK